MVVNRYHLPWVAFADDFTKSSTLLVQVQPLILDTTVTVQLIRNDDLRKSLMVCDHYQSRDQSKELAQIWHLIIKHNLYPDGSWHGIRFVLFIRSHQANLELVAKSSLFCIGTTILI